MGCSGGCFGHISTLLFIYGSTAPYFKKISKNTSIKAFVEGITAAVVGALVGAVFVIATRSIIDIPTILIAIATGLSLIYIKKLQEPQLILIAGILGIIIKNYPL